MAETPDIQEHNDERQDQYDEATKVAWDFIKGKALTRLSNGSMVSEVDFWCGAMSVILVLGDETDGRPFGNYIMADIESLKNKIGFNTIMASVGRSIGDNE
tara:strand:+ start:198 stop:500 length:303 start_codon:yes stop_codon:yes gene_type:complete